MDGEVPVQTIIDKSEGFILAGNFGSLWFPSKLWSFENINFGMFLTASSFYFFSLHAFNK